MEWLFGSSKTPAEMIRQQQRAINKAIRDLDRERTKLEQQQKKLVIDVKKMAKSGQINAVKIMAKDLVRTKRYVEKFIGMRTQLQAVSLKMQTLRSTQAMADAMKGVTKAMRRMNGQLKLPQIQQIMMDFERESEVMGMKEEMMNDAIDDAMDGEEDEEESEQIVAQVLEEIGINLEGELVNAPKNAPKGKEAAGEADDMDAQLQARLENLRRE